MRHFTCATLICFWAIATAVASSARTIHVPRDYSSIQAAVDAAKSGDSIHVAEGVYCESNTGGTIPGVLISTANIELVGEDGAIVDAKDIGPGTNGIRVVASNVTVRGMTVRNFDGGIVVEGDSVGSRIQANTVHNCINGVVCQSGSPAPAPRITIDHNTVTGNQLDGIVLDGCQNVLVTHNEVNNNGRDGIRATISAAGNTISHNTAFGNAWFDYTGFDAEDESGEFLLLTQNVWAHNKFGRTIGI